MQEKKAFCVFWKVLDKNFVIPIYQRNYDWKNSNCKQLFDDLESIVDDNYRSHFMGSIVHVYNQERRCYEYMIIDGQQRITTISLLLLAIYNLIKNNIIHNTEINIDKILNEYLIDKYASNEKKIKLKPIKDDCIIFESLFTVDDNNIGDSNITHNYNYFCERLIKSKYSIYEIYKAIECLDIVEIELKIQDDDPQLIFESLNSTGLGLTEADKVRNYILMKQNKTIQEKYYNSYWNKIERNTNFNVSSFLRDYLTIKRNKIPNINDVYFVFKTFHKNSLLNMEELLFDLLEYSKIYYSIINAKFENSIINSCIDTINKLETFVCYPFLLELFMDLKNNIITEKQCEEVLITVRNYIMRRIICEIPTNSLNKTFMTLNNDIKKYKDYSVHYSDICNYLFICKESYQRFPNDEGEHVRIIDNLLRWEERKNAQKSEAEKWENTGRNTMMTSRRMRSSYRMQAPNR